MIRKFDVKNFYKFDDFKITDFKGINIIIGENDTGKSGLLKLLYSISKSLEIYSKKSNEFDSSFKKELAEKMLGTFQPRRTGLGELVQKGSKSKLETEITYEIDNYRQAIRFSFGETTTKQIVDCNDHVDKVPSSFNSIFLPAKEVLTAFNAMKYTREHAFLNGFDDTYYDLIKALDVPTQRGRIAEHLSKVNEDLEKLFDGKILQTDKEDRFVFKKGNSEFTMPLTAEGVKKIGILYTLIANHMLNTKTILFMDEPETTLHPKATRKMADMIVSMSRAGIQVLLATHSYFLIKQLSIIAKRDRFNINCISLKNENGKVNYKCSDLISGLPDNPIISESLEMFDEEVKVDLG